jgi:vancomycin resistance protein VanJ
VVRASPESSVELFKDYGRSLFLTVVTLVSSLYLAAMIIYLPLYFVIKDRFWLLAFINNGFIYTFLPLLVILPLGVVMRRRWVIIPGVIIAIIAIVRVAPYFTPKFSAPPSGPTLSIITLDVDVNNPDLDAIKNWILESSADVIVLQRVNTFFIRTGQLSGSSIRYPFQHGVFFSDVPWGNFILSRYPIRKIDKLNIDRGSSIAMQQRYEIDVNGQIVAVYNVNFAYPTTPDGLPRIRVPGNIQFLETMMRYDPVMRDSQIRAFLDLIQNEKQPFVVAGDFNMGDQTQIYGEIARQMRDSFREVGFGLGATWAVSGGDGLFARLTSPLFRVDYMWHGDGLRTVSISRGPRNLGSDHLPLDATFELIAP